MGHVTLLKERHLKQIGTALLFLSILIFAFWIRSGILPKIPPGQFIGNDSYFYYEQARTISENGKLPRIDTNRWVPKGRDLSQTLPFYSYALAYTHKALALFSPNISLYRWVLYAPIVCFCIGLGALCFFLQKRFGTVFSSFVGILLATFPGTLERSVIGFSDRDNWVLMLGILAVITYLASLQTQKTPQRWFLTLASGLTVFLGGLSWEGFGMFLTFIFIVELWRFLRSESEEGLSFYLIWVLTFLPTLYLASPVYRQGEWFATHVAAFMLAPPLMLLGIRMCRHLLVTKTNISTKIQPYVRNLALGLTLVSLVLASGYVWIQFDTFARTTVPFSQTPLMRSVSELQAPALVYWSDRYGGVFVVASLGFVLTAIYPADKLKHFVFAIPLTLFTITTFFREPLENLWGIQHGNQIFFISVVSTVISFLIVAWRRREKTPNEFIYVAFGAWFFCWAALARDAIRYQFFIGIPFAFFTVGLIQTLSKTLVDKIRNSQYITNTFRQKVSQSLLKTILVSVMLTLLCFWQPVGGYARDLFNIAKNIRQPTPGITPITNAYRWMKAKLPNDAVVAASWNYGGQLNGLGGVKTITDPDHFLPHWIYLYFRHVFCAQSEREALEFLKTHNVTHLMLTTKDVFENAKMYSFIGSDKSRDREFQRTRLKISRTTSGKPWQLSDEENTPFTYIEAPSDINTTSVRAHLKNGKTVKLPCIAYSDTFDKISPLFIASIENPYGGILCVYSKFHEYLNLETASYISAMSWNSLAIKLFMRDTHSEAFTPIYPINENTKPHIKIWEIHYPPDIQPDVKYLKTGFPEIDKDLQIH